MVVYKCFMGVSGQAVAGRMKRLMSPGTPKSEAEEADATERWVESGRTLESFKSEYKLPDVFRFIAGAAHGGRAGEAPFREHQILGCNL